MSKSNRKPDFKAQREIFLKRSSEGWVSFRRFLFAPNLLTFVISVVVGNAFGGAVKDLITFVAHLVTSVCRWLFTKGHPAYFSGTMSAWNAFLTSFLTMLSIALVVYYTIQFINNQLIDSETEKWGYDEPHTDMTNLQNLQRENNKLMQENIELQKRVLSALEKNAGK